MVFPEQETLMTRFYSFLRGCALLLTLSAGAMSTGCAKDADVINQAAEVHKQLEPAIMRDPQLSNYLQSVGERIIASGKEMNDKGLAPKAHRSEDSEWMYSGKMKFHLVNSKTLNAFTTGGEHMYIYNELFQKCRSEDELAAVMAHEYAHVYCRHIHSSMDRQKGMLGLMVGGAAAGAVLGGKDNRLEGALIGGAAAAAVAQFAGLKFTRDDEAQADEYGMAFFWRAGWDPKRFGDFFQQLIDAGLDTTPEMLSDHPSLKSRVDIANQRARKLAGKADGYRKPPIADSAQFSQLKSRAKQLGQQMPEDKMMEQAQKILSSFSSCVTPEDQPDQVKARKQVTGHE
jgi:predicted Zn-dependent protease